MIQLQRFSLFANFSVQNFDLRTCRFITDFVIYAHTITDSQFDPHSLSLTPKPIFWVIVHDLNYVVLQSVLDKFSPWIRGILLRTSLMGFVEQPQALIHQTLYWKGVFQPLNIALGWCFDSLTLPKRNPKKPFPWIPQHDLIDLCYILPPIEDRLLYGRKHVLQLIQTLNSFAIPSYNMVIPYTEKNPVELDLYNLHGFSLETYKALPMHFPFYKEPFVRHIYQQ